MPASSALTQVTSTTHPHWPRLSLKEVSKVSQQGLLGLTGGDVFNMLSPTHFP